MRESTREWHGKEFHPHPHLLISSCCSYFAVFHDDCYTVLQKNTDWNGTVQTKSIKSTPCSWIASAISSINSQVLHCCLPTSTLLFAKFCQAMQEQQMVNSFWIELRSAVILPAIEKDSFGRSACRWCWQDPSSTQCSTWSIDVLSTPIVEHIRSPVSRADVAVEFIVGH